MLYYQLGVTTYFQFISFHGVDEVKPSYDSLIFGLVHGQLPDGEVGRQLGSFGRLCWCEFHDEICQDLLFIVVLGLYLMSNSLRSTAHFISLLEVFGLCSILFIGYSVGTSMV